MSDEKIEMNLIRGEAFLRVAMDEDTGVARFTCGIYPSSFDAKEDNEKDELGTDHMLGVFMAGIVNMIQHDMDTILHAGMEYLIEGNAPFDFIVSPEDAEYFENLTSEQRDLMRMEPKGEA